jgi:hypothetical protein
VYSTILLGVLGLASAIAQCVGGSVVWADIRTAVLLAPMLVVLRSSQLRLSRGESVGIDVLAMTAGLLIASWPTLLLAYLLSALVERVLGVLFGKCGQSWNDYLVSVCARCGVAFLFFLLARAASLEARVLPALLVGTMLSAADIVLTPLILGLRSGVRERSRLYEPLLMAYAVQVALGAAFIDTFDMLHWWGIGAGVLMAVVLQQGFNLLLSIRRGYTETIVAVGAVAEMGLRLRHGDTLKLADQGVRIGRSLGLPPRLLEKINHALLLSRVGELGEGEERELPISEALARSAHAVAKIPFLEGVPFLLSPEKYPTPGERGRHKESWEEAATVVRVCVTYRRAAETMDSGAAFRVTQEECESLAFGSRVLQALASELAGTQSV